MKIHEGETFFHVKSKKVIYILGIYEDKYVAYAELDPDSKRVLKLDEEELANFKSRDWRSLPCQL